MTGERTHAALERFEAALERVETAFAELLGRQEESSALISENRQLQLELERLRARARALQQASHEALERVEAAMARLEGLLGRRARR